MPNVVRGIRTTSSGTHAKDNIAEGLAAEKAAAEAVEEPTEKPRAKISVPRTKQPPAKTPTQDGAPAMPSEKAGK